MREFINDDCMKHMVNYEDNQFSLAIVDVPYGIGEHGKGVSRHRGGNCFTYFKPKNWDNDKPNKDYWQELFRVSQNQIIFGANYFVEYLKSTMGWVFWDKLLGGDFSDGELIYTSFQRALRKFTKSPEKNYSTNSVSAEKYKRIHPCQKPIVLYKWLLKNYAKPGDMILDSHVGSASSLIACEQMGFDYVGFELDKDYYKSACERIKGSRMQTDLFKPVIEDKSEQGSLF